jgi:hypothetical protein
MLVASLKLSGTADVEWLAVQKIHRLLAQLIQILFCDSDLDP